jgi:voltage-gated potassium channel
MTDDRALERIPWNSQTEDGQVLLPFPWELFVLAIAILSIINLVLLLLIRDPSIEQVVTIVDAILIIIFAIDFGRRIAIATDKRAYITRGLGWLDLISIIPLLRIARILRVVRVFRLLRVMGGPVPALRAFFADRASGGLYLVMVIAVIVLEYGSLSVLWAELGAPDANIETAGDAVWYTLVSMSTVGYGDQFPVTPLGRLIGSGIIIVGVGVFGTLTGFLANAFISPRKSGSDAAQTEGG